MSKLKNIGEISLIEKISRFCPQGKSVIKGIGDDAAVVRPGQNKSLLFTADMLIEDVHFRRKDDPRLIGHKALACSLSDIAAMGGIPKYALLSVAFPPELDVAYVQQIYRGLQKTAQKFKVDIVGGDTNSADKIIIDVFVCGEIEPGNAVMRSGAKNHDLIFVTGTLGGSIQGRHLRFTPRVKEAEFLVKNFKINSMIDISDGLAIDLQRLVSQSRMGAIISPEKIPLSAQAAKLENALYDGEDFELLFTLDRNQAEVLIQKWPFKKSTRLSCIGEVLNKHQGEIWSETKSGQRKKIKIKGYQHFTS